MDDEHDVMRSRIRAQVNDIAALLKGLVDNLRRDPEALDAEAVERIEVFLGAKVAQAGDQLRMLIARDPGVADRFDFDMPLASPETRRERHPTPAAATARQAPRAAVAKPERAASPTPLIPAGRMVGSKEIVLEAPSKPPAPEPQSGPADDFSDEPGFMPSN